MNKFIYTSIFCLLIMIHTQPVEASLNIVKSRPVDPSLLNLLRQGGYILYVRHGEATVGEDLKSIDFNDCSTQRNLSEAGRREAAQFGEAIRRLQSPIQTPVQASAFCRAKETAELAFGEDKVQTDSFWVRIFHLSNSLPPASQQATLSDLTSVLESFPPLGLTK